jgi:SRSO17 transposase
LADAGYGIDTNSRDGITALGLSYVVGIQTSTSLWKPGAGPLPPKRWRGIGRPPSSMRCDDKRKPASAKQMALALPKWAWHRVTWREDTNARLTSRFAAVRVRPAHRDCNRSSPRPEEWCLIATHWLADRSHPRQCGLSVSPISVTGAPPNSGGSGMPQRVMTSSHFVVRPRYLRIRNRVQTGPEPALVMNEA